VHTLKTFLLFVVFLFAAVVCFPQEQWSLERCISYAMEKNLQIKIQELNARMSKNNYVQSVISIAPSINGGINRYYSFGRRVDPFTNEFSDQNTVSDNYSLNGQFNVFNGFQTLNTIRKSKFDLLASLQNVEKIKNDMSLSIASAYLQVLYCSEQYLNAQNQTVITNKQVDRTTKLVNAGTLAKGNLLEIEAQIASEELQVVTAKNQLDMAYLTLAQMLDLDTIENFRIEIPVLPEPDEQLLLPSVSQVYSEALTRMPQIIAAEYQLKSSESSLAVTRGNRYPRVSLNGSFGTGYSDAMKQYSVSNVDTSFVASGFTGSGDIVYMPYVSYDQIETLRPYNDQLDYNVSKTISLSLSIPLFNGWQVNNAVSNAKLGVLNSKYSLDLARNQLYKDIQQAIADVYASLNKYIASKKSVTALQESFNYSQQKFDVGAVNSVDYYVAKNNLAKAESDLLQAKYEYIFKLKVLDFYRGNPIKL
jgi:outer membrane protein